MDLYVFPALNPPSLLPPQEYILKDTIKLKKICMYGDVC